MVNSTRTFSLVFFVCWSVGYIASKSPSKVDCKKDCTDSHSESEVCGTDGNTYPNLCELQAASCNGIKVTLAQNGACPPSLTPDGSDCAKNMCNNDKEPVCDPAAKTSTMYQNSCHFRAARCQALHVKEGEPLDGPGEKKRKVEKKGINAGKKCKEVAGQKKESKQLWKRMCTDCSDSNNPKGCTVVKD